MIRLIKIFNARHLRRKPLETFLVLLGIALGVAVMVGIDLANENALRSFHESVEAVAGKATHEITGGQAGVPDSVVARLMRNSSIIAAPVIEYLALCREAEDRPVRLLAIDPFADFSLRGISLQKQNRMDDERNALNRSSSSQADFNSAFESFMKFATLPNHALITESFAGQFSLNAGDSLHVLVNSVWKEVVIAGIIPLREGDRLSDEKLLIVDIATGQELLDRIGVVDRVDLLGDEDAIERLSQQLPPHLPLARPLRRSEYVDSMLSSFRSNLTALSLLAVFVGMFLIYNTMMFSVLQRRKQIGILRSLGVTRKQVMGVMFLEASLYGILGSGLGLFLGYFLSQYSTPAIGSTITDLYVFIDITTARVDGSIMAKGFMLGSVATLIAALLPALEAAEIAPTVATRRSSLETRASSFVPRFAIAGLGFFVVAVIIAIAPGGVLFGFAAALALAFAAVLFTPLFASAMTRLISSSLQRSAGTTGLLATRAIRGALSRTAVAIAALMISLAMVLGMQIMINSFRGSIQTWVQSILQADFYIAPIGSTAAKWQAILPDEFLQMIERLPEVEAVNTYRAGEFEYDGRLIYLVSLRGEVISTRTDFIFKQGTDLENWRALERGEVFVSESFVQRFGIAAGDFLKLRTKNGLRPFRVAAVFVDYSLDQGQVMMDHSTYEANWGEVRINSAGVFLKPNVDPKEFLHKLKTLAAGKYAVQVNSNLDLRRQVIDIFDKTFAITHVLQMLATIVAFIGIVSAILSLLVERTREFGTLRAIGMSWAQLRRMIFVESGLMGGLASLLAMPTGFALALMLVHVINVRSFGWLISIRSQPMEYAQVVGIAMTAAFLASLYPMWRLKRISVAAALREE
jgi:putative ABC transport system permease protein